MTCSRENIIWKIHGEGWKENTGRKGVTKGKGKGQTGDGTVPDNRMAADSFRWKKKSKQQRKYNKEDSLRRLERKYRKKRHNEGKGQRANRGRNRAGQPDGSHRHRSGFRTGYRRPRGRRWQQYATRSDQQKRKHIADGSRRKKQENGRKKKRKKRSEPARERRWREEK